MVLLPLFLLLLLGSVPTEVQAAPGGWLAPRQPLCLLAALGAADLASAGNLAKARARADKARAAQEPDTAEAPPTEKKPVKTSFSARPSDAPDPGDELVRLFFTSLFFTSLFFIFPSSPLHPPFIFSHFLSFSLNFSQFLLNTAGPLGI